ncbi:MFS transporter [Mycolicibacterium goodii]|uniref:MFS transporter n=1 Tax=Mycolicibacterium goodii TaxID=134601 RepID=UPI0027E0D25B|nr:MFS transporter [Mycolicibacterium goodii]
MATFVFGVVEAPVRGWTHPSVWGAMAGGVALGAAFTVVELRRTHPLLDVRLFGDPHFATGSAGVTFLFFASFGFFFVSMQYIQLVMGYSPIATAVALCPLAVPILAFGATTRRYLPLLGLRLTASFGLLLTAVGLWCLRTLEIGSSYLDFAWPLLIMSVGIGLCTAPATSAIMGAVPDEKQGVASAVNDTTREVVRRWASRWPVPCSPRSPKSTSHPRSAHSRRPCAPPRSTRSPRRSRRPGTWDHRASDSPKSHSRRSSMRPVRPSSSWVRSSRWPRCSPACGAPDVTDNSWG